MPFIINPWNSIPQHLTSEEINDPFKVIDEFFDAASLASYKENLLEWLQTAFSSDYNWQSGSPGSLFSLHSGVERVVEAAWLINQVSGKDTEKAGSPNTFLEEFFEFHSLSEWKRALFDWLEIGLSRFSICDGENADEIFAEYKCLEGLFETVYLIHEKKHKSRTMHKH